MNQHPGIARAIMGVVPTSENALAAADSLLGMLLAGGLHPAGGGLGCDLLPLYVTAISFEETFRTRPVTAGRTASRRRSSSPSCAGSSGRCRPTGSPTSPRTSTR